MDKMQGRVMTFGVMVITSGRRALRFGLNRDQSCAQSTLTWVRMRIGPQMEFKIIHAPAPA